MPSLKEAFEFFFEFKAGNIEIEKPVTVQHAMYIKWLAMDLLAKEVEASELPESALNELLTKMTDLDSQWNHSLQRCLNHAYRLIEQGLLDDASKLLASFVKSCPSRFYAEIAAGVKEEIFEKKRSR
ncbi:MAG: hypothetical protein LBV44_00935 [Methylobacillus sp.]|jgi:hypothetical protein|nr:hypothetical protein [Methylobacillus sp.]